MSFYPLTVPLLFKGADQELFVKLSHAENDQRYTLNPGFSVTSIAFDPNYEIIAPHPANRVLDIQENDIQESVIMSPNPVSDKLSIKVNRGTKVTNLDIVNSEGKRVYYLNNDENNRRIEIAVSQFPVGHYYLRIQTPSNTLVKQIIKN